MEALIYLVFKVLLRQSAIKVAFQVLGCQEGWRENSPKTLCSWALENGVNLETGVKGFKTVVGKLLGC
ncbi:hypothetical protein [Fortiea contorta]|uniref:hypothetical protein n=1 Tax=Fortiea contorta TaxID=1892405 RepID=UPI00034DA0DC|nr:hypothetical protein [Fortiea contorta]